MDRSLDIELIDDCVFSARAATEGAHESLDRIPGTALLGAAASALYKTLDRQEAFAAFHSGRLRFGDGLPWDGQNVAYPVPLCWHYPKEREPAEGKDPYKWLRRDRIQNFVHTRPAEGGEPKQLRGGYVRNDGRWVQPKRSLRLKTAIDPAKGHAEEGQLFGYDAVAQGQRFVARLEADAEFDPALFEKIVEALSGDVLLGRSRSAEYGRAQAQPTEVVWPAAGAKRDDGQLVLWLLSDLALADTEGQPTLTPNAELLGVPGAKISWPKTFLRTRRYSPWNAARHGYDRERLVLAAGGVITLELDRPLTDSAINHLQAGVGLYREAGLGRLWVNPPLLAGENPAFDEMSSHVSARPTPAKPNDPLIAWLENQANVDWKANAEQKARSLADDYREKIQAGRRLLGVSEEEPFGPSKSQWSRILNTARNAQGRELYNALFEGKGAVVKSTAEGWQEETVDDEGRPVPLAEWLKQQLAASDDARAYAHQVRQLARRVQDDIERRRI